MVQREKAPKPKSKERSKARPTSRRSRGAHTDPECLGADVNALVTQRLIALGKRQLGAVPQFWGRYFKGPGDQNPVRYQAQLEGPPMQSLRAEYYRGWSDALIAGGQSGMVFRDADNADPITFWPGVYGAEGDDNTWNSLVAAIADGAVCRGTWIARPGKIGCHPLGPWNEQFIRPKSLPSSVPVLVWQGVQECRNIDYNRANPAVSTDLVSGLVLPPSLSDWLIS